ncbi:hypothetical protein [Knoellia sp. LjRoot47]|uniref:hypothetical protein n=1 Tax=Knoellia sp. LjRoot47 TaxID=3342330 RepID=UPI003ECC7D30
MGEKGNALDGGMATVASMATGLAAEPSVIERVTTTTSETLLGVGKDALGSVKDKALDKGADATIDEARRRLRRREDPAAGAQAPLSADATPADEDGGDVGPRA